MQLSSNNQRLIGARAKIYDVHGSVQREISLDGPGHTISGLSNLAAGVYILRIEKEGQLFEKLFVKK